MKKNYKNYSHDNKIFNELIIFLGRDINYNLKVIRMILKKKIKISAIVGETANKVLGNLKLLKKKNIKIISKRRPWENHNFNSLIKKNTLGVTSGFNFIIKDIVLDKLPIVNTHPSFLPHNRGCHHSFWGIINKTKLGATIHWMSPGLDEGPIISQKSFKDDGFITAEQIQTKSENLCFELLDKNIKPIMNGKTYSYTQKNGSYHSKKEIQKRSTISEKKKISGKDLFDLCRATNNKLNGFIINKNKRSFLIRIYSIEEIDIKKTN